jgi:hypothetical protein
MSLILPSTKLSVLYSDTCWVQSRNSIETAMPSKVGTEHPALQILEHKFLEQGHAYLECDSDHAGTERAKKNTTVKIGVPQDWCLFVVSVRGKTPLNVVGMKISNFVMKNMDSARQKFSWFQIHLMRYETIFEVFLFKYSVDENEPISTLAARRCGRGMPFKSTVEVPKTYSTSVPIHPLKKRDLFGLLPLMDLLYHAFYQSLTRSESSLMQDRVVDISESEEEA